MLRQLKFLIFIIFLAIMSLLVTLWYNPSPFPGLQSMLKGTRSIFQQSSSETGTSGTIFKGVEVQKFSRHLSRYGSMTEDELDALIDSKKSSFAKYTIEKNCDSWVVLTTIFIPSESVRKAAQLKGWCVVVVADKKSAPTYDVNNTVYLSVEAQEKLADDYSFIKILPWNHFGRKNVGYFYALLQGARYIFDLDDDNVLKQISVLPPTNVSELTTTNCSVFNVYSAMGASEHPAWPRGFPLDRIKQTCDWSLRSQEVHKEELIIFQSLADNDPDVDAIYRMTLRLPFHFKGRESLGITAGVFVPYNAQASLHHEKSFWGLLLPISVHSRVSDIWRSYITQRLIWEIGSRLAFVPPWVIQYRNPHNYIQDFQAETDLYLKTGALLEFLLNWRAQSPTLPGIVEELYIELYEHGFIGKVDVELLQAWLESLLHVGYAFSSLTHTFPPTEKISRKNRSQPRYTNRGAVTVF